MRAGLTALGVILLLIGVALYFMPTPNAQAVVGLDGEEKSFSLQVAAGILALGLITAFLGVVLPAAQRIQHYGQDDRSRPRI